MTYQLTLVGKLAVVILAFWLLWVALHPGCLLPTRKELANLVKLMARVTRGRQS